MALQYLRPIDETLYADNSFLSTQALGNKMTIHSSEQGFPDLKHVKIALISLEEMNVNALPSFRKELYRLFPGNWEHQIADLGVLEYGHTTEDTFFALQECISELHKQNILTLILAKNQETTLAMYQYFQRIDTYMNLTSVDAKFDFGDETQMISEESYMSKIIQNTPSRLLNFYNVGYQTYLNSQEEIDLMNSLYFDAYRLGEVKSDISMVEPIFRDTDVLSIDFSSLKSTEIGAKSFSSPNGFDNHEMCTLARYAGLSDRISCVGLFDSFNTQLSAQLVAQVIWYLIEGFHFRVNEYPFSTKAGCKRYLVPSDGQDLVFYQSDLSDRWWIEVLNNKNGDVALLPCTKDEYLKASGGKIPDRWWKAIQRSII